MSLHEPLSGAVGAKTAAAMAAGLGLHTVGDLLHHYPRRYATRGELTDLAALRPDEDVTVLAEVDTVVARRMRHRRGSILEAVVTDGRSRLTLTFFNQVWRERDLRPGRRGLFAGKVGVFNGRRQLAHPDYVMLPDEDDEAAGALDGFVGALIPVYPATGALKSWQIAQSVGVLLDSRLDDVPEPLPAPVRERQGLLPSRDALVGVHRPIDRRDLARALDRLRFEEAFVLQAELARRRRATVALPAVARRRRADGLAAAFDAAVPFTLTDGQRAVGAEIEADLAGSSPMHRLLQGEVGSGKTLVALRAMLVVVDAGAQAALLAPTEVLAQQHHRSLVALLGPLAQAGRLGGADQATRVALLTGSLGAAHRREALLEAAGGAAGIVVGTHALLEERVRFADLGLVVVDEQHRFGVEQRAALADKGVGVARPHVLVMTATPIPRTVAMTVFGDLEVSTLAELPAGRADVVTHVVAVAEKPHFLDRGWARIREEVAAGRQAYVVCPRIGDDGDHDDTDDTDDTDGTDGTDDTDATDGTDHEDAEDHGGRGDGADTPVTGADAGGTAEDGGPTRRALAVLDVAAQLAAGPLAGLSVAVLHGRLDPDAKETAMRRFAAGGGPDGVDVLVATTVIEVGVDVPNATVMVVMDADRFGVSQLHQLRGRIGRGHHPGLCLLVTEAAKGSPVRARLDAVAATRDGFVLARVDLQQRREGDVLGASQSGRRSSLRLLSVLRDEDVIVVARGEATRLVEVDPDLDRHPDLRHALDELLDAERAEYLEKA